MRKLLIKNGFVASVDPTIGNIANGDVLISGDRIEEVGRDLEVTDAEIVDATDCIVMPGFVDAHKHIWQGAAVRAYCTDWSLDDYVNYIRLNVAAAFGAEDMYAVQLHGAFEAMNAGVTTAADYCHNIHSPDHAHEAIRGLQDSGMRVVWNYGFNYPPLENPVFKTFDDRVAFGRDVAKTHFSSKDQLLTLGIAPEELQHALDNDTLSGQFNLARELGAHIFWHCNSKKPLGIRIPRGVARVHDLGLLGDDILFVHMSATEEDEWKMVADCGASVVFTPDTELQMGMMWPSGDIAKRYGITQSYGTDITSNNSADMFTALRLGLQTTRCRVIDREDLLGSGVPFTCEEALRWGTIDGAKALGLESAVGSLTPGKKADLVFLNTKSLSLVGWDRSNVAGTIILQGQTADVDSVMVNGRFVKRHGKMVGDVARVCELLEAARARISETIEQWGGRVLNEGESDRRMAAMRSSESGTFARG
ncbi:amidohydrolase family protein [Amorphus sp. 3PC139-8]|uniref:amidohydrolase family protein n=1 Tax=Amorphus sp. 3PC139-8 TaxID=2735676 RepID=UPI00345C713B